MIQSASSGILGKFQLSASASSEALREEQSAKDGSLGSSGSSGSSCYLLYPPSKALRTAIAAAAKSQQREKENGGHNGKGRTIIIIIIIRTCKNS